MFVVIEGRHTYYNSFNFSINIMMAYSWRSLYNWSKHKISLNKAMTYCMMRLCFRLLVEKPPIPQPFKWNKQETYITKIPINQTLWFHKWSKYEIFSSRVRKYNFLIILRLGNIHLMKKSFARCIKDRISHPGMYQWVL